MFFFFQAEDGIRDHCVTGVQTCALPISNRVHPIGKGSAIELRRRVHAVVGAKLFVPDGEPVTTAVDAPVLGQAATGEAPSGRTRTGLDRLVAAGWASLAGRSVGLASNQTGVDAQGRRGVDLMAAAGVFKLRALFSPEHGLDGTLD